MDVSGSSWVQATHVARRVLDHGRSAIHARMRTGSRRDASAGGQEAELGWRAHLFLAHRRGINAMSFRPKVQIRAPINDLAAQSIIGRAQAFMAPLGKFFAVPDDFEFGVAEDVVAIGFKQVRHGTRSLRCVGLQRKE